MPNYDYWCMCSEGIQHRINVPMEERDSQKCSFCYASLRRKYTFTGSVWAPTAGGMR